MNLPSAGAQVELYVHDLAGQEVYGDLISKICGGKMAALILAFDMTSEKSFREAQECLFVAKSQMRNRDGPLLGVLVGCKADLAVRGVSSEEVSHWAAHNGLEYIETSSTLPGTYDPTAADKSSTDESVDNSNVTSHSKWQNFANPFKRIAEKFEQTYKAQLQRLESAAQSH